MQATIEIAQNIVGPILVKPFVDFKKPLAVIPRMIARKRNIYPDKFVIFVSFNLFYQVG
jgi:hypothetical protein